MHTAPSKKAKPSRLNLQLTPKAARPDRGGTTASKRQDDHVGSTSCTSSESKSRQATIGDVEVTSDPKIVRTAHREVCDAAERETREAREQPWEHRALR
jgi:hypothetical protein